MIKKSPHFYVYVIRDPRSGDPIYVGKGTRRRMYQHEKSHNRFLMEIVYEIRNAGLRLIYEKVFESDDESACYKLEIELIEKYGRDTLCNVARGGQGPPSGDDHPSKDPKIRAKLSAARIGRFGGEKHPMYGKNHTPEAIEKNREAHIGLNAGEEHWTFGIPRTEKDRAAIKAAVPRGEDHALFGVKGEDHPAFGYKHTPEEVEEIRQATLRRLKEDPTSCGFQKGHASPDLTGENNGRSKLKESDVWALHDRYHLGKETVLSLAGDRDRCGYMSNLLTGNIWPKVHAAWREKNPGYEMRIGEHRKDPEVTARRVANLVPKTAEARTAKSNKTWATRKLSK